jgi:hypothetical protein
MITQHAADLSLEQALNDFDRSRRAAALAALLARQPQAPSPAEVANLHCHTFFSFNAYGYSPTALAWLARERGIKLLGIVDFDVLDAVDEFLDACEQAEVRGSAGIESRVFIPEFADREINSPGEPGVYYHMGVGFSGGPISAEAAAMLGELRAQSAERNRALVARVNSYLAPVGVDYEADVLPLTPAGNATERHIVVAYIEAARRMTDDPAAFWSAKLGMERSAVEKAMADNAGFQNTVRNKLMKKGGPGYVQPGPDTFPPVEKLNALTVACGALPCAAWLDGLSPGEQAIEELMNLLVSKGIVAFNIIPDRNWNLPDPKAAALKQQKLYEVVELAQALDLPLNVGTEMNSFGQKIVDDFAAPALAPVRDTFLDGAYFVYGHTALARSRGLGYQSEWAKSYLPTRKERNQFYTAVGKRAPAGAAGRALLAAVQPDMAPKDILAALSKD